MRKIFSVSSLILGIVFFVVFMVAACAAYYLTAGVFVTAELAVLYAALGLSGALAMVFRGYIFAALFYIGCALGWATGHYISGLEGDFAPTAGVIATFFLIGCFALIGLILEISRMRRRRRRKQKEAERLAEEQRQKVLAEQETESKAEEARVEEETAKASEGTPESASEEPSGK